jgi:nucleotide-binding universal stress UspA family protein
VVGIDGSDASKAVLPAAIELALALGADIRVVEVVLALEVIKVAVPRTSEAIALDDVVKQIHDAGVSATYAIIDDGDTSGRLTSYRGTTCIDHRAGHARSHGPRASDSR